jgi:hypothetical protein
VSAIIKSGLLGPAGLIFLGVLISAVGAFWAAVQQNSFERELRVRSDKIAELSQNALHSVTGGDSFCYIHFMDIAPGVGKIIVVHNGSYPIYDVEARIVDLDKFATAQTSEEEIGALAGENIHVGNLTRGFSRAITAWKETIPGQLRLNVFFVARNGSYTQNYRRVRVEDGCAIAIRVNHNGEYVLEEVSEKYPRNESGEVEWE